MTEFIHRAASTQPDLLISMGSCDAQTGPLDPYLPFREALTSLVLESKGMSPANLRSNISPPNPPKGGTGSDSPASGGSGGLTWTDMPLKAQPPQRIRQIASRALLEYGPQLLPLFVPAAELPGVVNTARQAGWQGEAPPAPGEGQAPDQSRIFEQGAAVLQAIAALIPLVLVLELPESLARDQQEFALQFNLGRVLATSKGFAAPEVGEAYARALALGRQLEETQQIIQVLHGLTQHALFRSELALAQTYGQECLRLVTESQDPERLLEAYQILWRIAHRNGQHAEAVTYGEQVIAFYRAHRPSLTFDDAYALAFTLAAMGLNLVPLGYPDRALGQAQEGLILAQSHAHHFGTAYCLNFMAYIHLLRGDWQEALQFAKKDAR